jgi:chaperonin GroES
MNISDITPLYSRIIVEADYKDKTVSGLLIPKSARRGSMDGHRGKIVSIGDEVTDVKVGEHIIYGQYSGTKFNLGNSEDDKYLIMNEEDVLCKIKTEVSD